MRGLSRRDLSLVIAEAFPDPRSGVCPGTIKGLETGSTKRPSETTAALLCKVLPELSSVNPFRL